MIVTRMVAGRCTSLTANDDGKPRYVLNLLCISSFLPEADANDPKVRVAALAVLAILIMERIASKKLVKIAHFPCTISRIRRLT
jgi:hypothetical protein